MEYSFDSLNDDLKNDSQIEEITNYNLGGVNRKLLFYWNNEKMILDVFNNGIVDLSFQYHFLNKL